MTDKFLTLDPTLYTYLQSISPPEAPILAALRAETAGHPASQMQISPEQGQFMALLVRLMGARRTLEIGTFTGYSALVVALALPPEGKLVACDKDPETAAIARRYWQQAGVADKIDLHLGPALDTLDRLLGEGAAGSFDFAFIDADKRNYGPYFERALALIRPGGAIAIDNVLWSGRVADPQDSDPRTEAIRKFNASLLQDRRLSAISVVPIADGVTLALKASSQS